MKISSADRDAYAAEAAIERACSQPGPLAAQGTTWQVEPMPQYFSVKTVEAVCALICTRFELAPVTVRLRRGSAAIAHYERRSGAGTVALSPDQKPWSHATLIHEVAHHAEPDDGHGPRWRQAQVTMLAAEGLVTMAHLLSAAYDEIGLGYPDPNRLELS